MAERSISPSLGRRPYRLICILGVMLGTMVVHSGWGIALVAPGVLAILGLLALVRGVIRWDDPQAERRILRWTLAAFGARLLVGLVVTGSDSLRIYFASDSLYYHRLAIEIVDHWTTGFPLPVLPGGKEGFYYLLAGLYWVFGPHSSAALVVNAAMAAAMIPIISDTTVRLFGRHTAYHVPLLLVLVPSLFVFPAQLLKEAAILFFLAVAANASVRINERLGFVPLAVLASSLSLLLTFRAWVALVCAQGLLAGIVIGKRQVISGMTTGVVAVAILAVLVVPLGLGYSGYKAAVNADLEQANRVRIGLATDATSGFASDVDISSSSRAISYLPRGLVTLWFGPFPWHVSSLRHLPALLDVLVLWILLPALARGGWAAWQRSGRRILVLVLPALTTSVLLALAIGNFGTITRERMQLLVLLAPFVSLGLWLRRPADVVQEQNAGASVVQHA